MALVFAFCSCPVYGCHFIKGGSPREGLESIVLAHLVLVCSPVYLLSDLSVFSDFYFLGFWYIAQYYKNLANQTAYSVLYIKPTELMADLSWLRP